MPALHYLFILCAEVSANAVRKDGNIRGINIANVECKLSQYADDTTIILDGFELSLSRTLLLLDNYAMSSWFKINYEKTEALWKGSCKDRDFAIPSLNRRSFFEFWNKRKQHWFSWKNWKNEKNYEKLVS